MEKENVNTREHLLFYLIAPGLPIRVGQALMPTPWGRRKFVLWDSDSEQVHLFLSIKKNGHFRKLNVFILLWLDRNSQTALTSSSLLMHLWYFCTKEWLSRVSAVNYSELFQHCSSCTKFNLNFSTYCSVFSAHRLEALRDECLNFQRSQWLMFPRM